MNNLTEEEELYLTHIAAESSVEIIAKLMNFSEFKFEKFSSCMDYVLSKMKDAHEYAYAKNKENAVS